MLEERGRSDEGSYLGNTFETAAAEVPCWIEWRFLAS